MATRRTQAPEPEAAILHAILAELQQLNQTLRAIESRLGARAEGDMDPGRPVDPGDSVPEGVAVQEPLPLTSEDKKVRRALEQLPRRAAPRKGKK